MKTQTLAKNERAMFSKRLQCALENAGLEIGPTALQRAFNVIYEGPPVMVHAVRKWIVGEAIPVQAKLRTLAEMLGVSVEWLRFGSGAARRSGGMNIAGHIFEAGAIEEGSHRIGFSMRRTDGSTVTIIGLTEAETRAVGPFFMEDVTITVAGAAA